MLRLDLGKIRTAHEHFEQVHAPETLRLDGDEFDVVRPVALAFDVYKDKQQFRLAGRVATTLALRCSRCLEAFESPVEAAFDLRYQPRTPQGTSGEREVQEDDLGVA